MISFFYTQVFYTDLKFIITMIQTLFLVWTELLVKWYTSRSTEDSGISSHTTPYTWNKKITNGPEGFQDLHRETTNLATWWS